MIEEKDIEIKEIIECLKERHIEIDEEELHMLQEALAGRELPHEYEARAYNIMAYFWLNAYDYFIHAIKAKTYFEEMERRDIKADNPYKGFYGKTNHEELVRMLIDGEYNQMRRGYLNKYVAALAKEIASGRADEADLMDLKETIQALHRDNMFSKNDKALDLWDHAVVNLCQGLKNICDSREGDCCSDIAGEFAICLTEWDNWLLRYIELESDDKAEGTYYSEIEEWEKRIEKLSDDRAWIMLSSLREILINRYHETGETEKLIEMLEKHTGYSDTAVHFIETLEGCKGKRYCTYNTMALLNLLFSNGNTERAEEIINEIAADTEEVEKTWTSFEYEGAKNNWLKYIILLESHQFYEEAAKWRKRLSKQFGMDDEEVHCEISYLKGDFTEAIRNCKYNTGMKEMLEYILSGNLPEYVAEYANPDEIEIADQNEIDSICFKGSLPCMGVQREIFMTSEEWHCFAASSETLPEMFQNGLQDTRLYPRDFYKIPLVFDPEPAIMRGDFIKNMYK